MNGTGKTGSNLTFQTWVEQNTAKLDRSTIRNDHVQLVDVIGEEATIELADLWAGTRLYIPRRVKEDHKITRCIGRAAAQKLTDRYSGTYIRVPLARELRAKQLRERGFSIKHIAGVLGLTEGGVRTLFKRLEQHEEASSAAPKAEEQD